MPGATAPRGYGSIVSNSGEPPTRPWSISSCTDRTVNGEPGRRAPPVRVHGPGGLLLDQQVDGLADGTRAAGLKMDALGGANPPPEKTGRAGADAARRQGDFDDLFRLPPWWCRRQHRQEQSRIDYQLGIPLALAMDEALANHCICLHAHIGQPQDGEASAWYLNAIRECGGLACCVTAGCRSVMSETRRRDDSAVSC